MAIVWGALSVEEAVSGLLPIIIDLDTLPPAYAKLSSLCRLHVFLDHVPNATLCSVQRLTGQVVVALGCNLRQRPKDRIQSHESTKCVNVERAQSEPSGSGVQSGARYGRPEQRTFTWDGIKQRSHKRHASLHLMIMICNSRYSPAVYLPLLIFAVSQRLVLSRPL